MCIMKKKNKTTKTKITNEVSKFPDPKDTKWIPGKINDSKRRDNNRKTNGFLEVRKIIDLKERRIQRAVHLCFRFCLHLLIAISCLWIFSVEEFNF